MTFVAKLGGVSTLRPKAARLRDPPPKDVFGSFPYLKGTRPTFTKSSVPKPYCVPSLAATTKNILTQSKENRIRNQLRVSKILSRFPYGKTSLGALDIQYIGAYFTGSEKSTTVLLSWLKTKPMPFTPRSALSSPT